MQREREKHNTLFRVRKRIWLTARGIPPGGGCVPLCVYCDAPMRIHVNAPAVPDEARAATLDHVDPRRKRGRNSPDNVVASCRACNAAKGERTPAQWARSGGPPDAAARAARQIASLPRQKTIRCLRGLWGVPEEGGLWASPVITPAQRRGY